MNSSRKKVVSVASSCPLLVAALGSSASAGLISVDPSYFGASATVITFDEVPEGTPIPFTIGIADFTGSGGLTYSFGPGDPAAPPAPSGDPFLYTGSIGQDDWIEVALGAPQEAVGAYFNVGGGIGETGILQMEFYSGASLLGIISPTPDINAGGFVGGSVGSAIIDRVIFRDIDRSLPISFRIDDFQFVPAPGGAVMLALTTLRRRRRH